MIKILEWPFVACCLWGMFQTGQFIVWNVKRCCQAAQVRSKPVLSLVLRQLMIQVSSNGGWKVIGFGALLLFSPLTFHVSHSPASYAITSYLVFYALFNLSEVAVPASILLLGTSNLKCLCLFSRMDIEAFPYRAVLLLAPSGSDISALSEQSDLNFKYNNVRQLNGNSWQDSVLSLAADVPIIVVDGRHRANAVDWELASISESPELLAKSLVISDANGETPALEGLAPTKRKLFRCQSDWLQLGESLSSSGLLHIISWREKSHWEKMFYQIAYRAVSAQTKMISRRRVPITCAVNRYAQQHGYTPFYFELIQMLDKFGRANGTGLLGAVAGINTEIGLLSTFLNRWTQEGDPDYADLIGQLTTLHADLHRLKLVAETYPEIWDPRASEYVPQFGFANKV